MKERFTFIGTAILGLGGMCSCDPYSMAGLGVDSDTQKLINMATQLGNQAKDAQNASGEIVMSNGAAQPWSTTVSACASGERRGFPGVDLTASTPSGMAALRIVVDPIDGARARLTRTTSSGASSWPLEKSACSVLQANIAKTNVRINQVSVLEGNANLDCTLDDGTNVVADVAFSSCHSSADAESVLSALQTSLEQREMDRALPIPQEVAWPTVPPSIQALKIHPTMRSVGAVIKGDKIDKANSDCLAATTALLTKVGMKVVESGDADVEADFRCTGHVTFRDSDSSVEVLLPKTSGAAVTLRVGKDAVDALPVTTTALRCDIPGGKSAARTQSCMQRIASWSDARFANWIVQSKPLLALASNRSHRD